MKDLKLPESEYRFVKIIWQNEPISSKDLVTQCEKELDWKKSTTYTVLKRLCDKGIVSNENSCITSLVKQAEVQRFESAELITRSFDGSLPQFFVAFMSGKKLSDREAERLKQLIDAYKEE
ncbi:MAG: BlaI/MecI/CopY family transcriptional regulator [Oscillospiraceae bacterium]